MRVLQHYQIPLTLVTFANCYKRLSSLKLSNQALWLRDKTVMLVLVAGAASSWTYVVTLGCSSSMGSSGEFTCLANGGRNTLDYIVGSPVVW
jgi:hypothetical protein